VAKLKVVVNTSVIISALMKRHSLAYYALTRVEHDYFTPAYALTEIFEYLDEIEHKSELTPLELFERLFILLELIKVVGEDAVREHIDEAIKIMERRDVKDAPFLAALMAVSGDAILSYDEDFSEVERHGYKWLRPSDLLAMT